MKRLSDYQKVRDEIARRLSEQNPNISLWRDLSERIKEAWRKEADAIIAADRASILSLLDGEELREKVEEMVLRYMILGKSRDDYTPSMIATELAEEALALIKKEIVE